MTETPVAAAVSSTLKLRRIAAWCGIRALAWNGDVLYGSRGYSVVRLRVSSRIGGDESWEVVARFRPAWWRNLTSCNVLSSRLVRDGFHALAILDNNHNDDKDYPVIIGTVPGALVTRFATSDEFLVTHRLQRGTRPLHITAVPSGRIYWGEYFDNRERAEVHIFASSDHGRTWQIAYTFPAGGIRHVHNIVYDRWRDCLWILTGDEGAECKVLRASCDLSSVEVVVSGNQQARAVAAIPAEEGLFFSTDTPFEKNHIYRLDRAGSVAQVGDLGSSSIFGCRVGRATFFSTMVEPSTVNDGREVHLVGSIDERNWTLLSRWKKDRWPMHLFQYGNLFLPDGENSTPYLAATTIAVERDDLVTTLWEVEPA